ncbi:MAG: glycosyltransferase family 9 protein [Bacteroidota bacterium]|nr:glycosyltransferase family 9 protein [Bacteroidota bacterium]
MVKILIIQHKMIGDVLICSLLCKNIKLWNPDAKIDFVANRHTLDVIRNNPYIDDIIIFEDNLKKDKWGLLKFLSCFRKKRYDYVIDAYGKLESVLICLFTPARYKIGYKKIYSSFVYNQSIERKKTLEDELQLSIKNRLELLEPIMGDFPKNSEVEIHLTPEEIKNSREHLNSVLGKGNKAIMVSALGSSENKTYPFEYMAQLMDTAHQITQLPFILNYRPNQKTQINQLIDHLQPSTQKAVIKSLTPNSLRDYMATAYHCIAVVGNEGGAINIAKGLKKPTFAIFSPLIDPIGWHTEIPNKSMAVNLQMFFPNKINYKDHRKIAKDPAKVMELYKMLKPELFKKQWINFFKNFISN